jgi:hypothetical protein
VSANGRSTEPAFFAALELAKAGFPVFPVKGKEPSVEGGFYAGTTDVSQVAAWITEGREHHDVAFATGIPFGVVVVDADTPEAFERMREGYGEPTVRTKRGGHWYFRHPRDGKVKCGQVSEGLDCKGDGGFVVAPPSRGRVWTDDIPERMALPVLPAEFRRKVLPRAADEGASIPKDARGKAAEAIARRVANIAPGPGRGRHQHLTHLCGVLLGRDVSFADAEAILVEAWSKVGGDLADRAEREVRNTLRTTEQAIADGRATGVPSLEEITPGLYAELEEILAWKVQVAFGMKQPGEQEDERGIEDQADRRNQADRLIGYALDDVEDLFVDQHGSPHALINGEPVPLNSRCYSWLRRLMWGREEKAVNGEYLKTAAGTLAAHAEFSGEVRELHTRAAWHDGALYYELGSGRVVCVDGSGWRLEPASPVRFRRFPNLKPLPDPERGGSIKEIAGYANLKTSRDRRLFTAYTVTLPLPHVGRPIFNASGAMGSGKTTIGRILKRSLDPSAPETVRLDPRDFLQKASHAYILMLDNQNTIPEWGADTLCRLVTGEADSKRRLYTDDEDVIIELRRAVLLNGINVPTDRGDVLDRSLVVELERIPDAERRTEEELWERFEAEHPKLLGALFDVLSQAIALKPSLKLSRRPRLADWGEYAASVYEVMGWGAETFLKDWDEVVKVQNQATLDGSPVAQAIIKFMEDKKEYTATSSELHSKLKVVAAQLGVDVDRDKAWPKSARWLWRRIKEVLPLLVAAGIEAARGRDESAKQLTLRKPPTNDGSDGRRGKSGATRGKTHANNGPHDGSSNGSESDNGSSNGSEKPPRNVGSANTADTANRSGDVSEVVTAFLANPPEWYVRQANECVRHGAPERLLKPLATAVAYEVFDNTNRWSEVLPHVEAHLRGEEGHVASRSINSESFESRGEG